MTPEVTPIATPAIVRLSFVDWRKPMDIALLRPKFGTKISDGMALTTNETARRSRINPKPTPA